MYEIKNIDQVKNILEENKMNIKVSWIFHNFWRKVDIKDNKEECWNWTACTSSRGYGIFWLYDKKVMANRVSYMLSKGAISDKMFVMHKCNNPRCCNPNHLELGNRSKNMRYMVACHRQGSILTEDQVREIHKLYNEQRKLHPGYKQWMIMEPIAKKFGIVRQHVSSIILGKTWHHIYQELNMK